MNIINFLLMPRSTQLPPVEAYYREAMELKFAFRPQKRGAPIVIPPFAFISQKIKIANVAATANIPLPLEIIDLEKKLGV